MIPGHANQPFLAQENEDGSILLQPASVVTDAQLEYDGDPELQALLTRALAVVHGAPGPSAPAHVSADDAHSQVADRPLDSLEAGPDADLYNAVLDACELIFRLPAQAQARSTAITTHDGIRLRLPVAGHPPYNVFWSSDGPRIETVFPRP